MRTFFAPSRPPAFFAECQLQAETRVTAAVNATSFHVFSEDFVQDEPLEHERELIIVAAMQKQCPG